MSSRTATITKRTRNRRLSSGRVIQQHRYVVNFRDPVTGQRNQRFYERHKDALAARDEIAAGLRDGSYKHPRSIPTVREAVEHWLQDREGRVKGRSIRNYRGLAEYIVGPLLVGTPKERNDYKVKGALPSNARFHRMLGDTNLSELSTAQIRAWHKIMIDEVGRTTASKAKSALATVLALAAEDFGVRVPLMPRKLDRGPPRTKKPILTLDQVGTLLEAAQRDLDWGVYYAWPFLTGTRPSEQLAMLWEAIDFERDTIHIRRMQEINGTLTEFTKTEAGDREIPMCALLKRMLLDWRVRCPRLDGELYRVFPSKGRPMPWPQTKRIGSGGSHYYSHFRSRVWHPAFKRLGLPAVAPHSARHLFISALQAQGVEVGLVAKLAGHANANVTLGHYTQAVRGGAEAVEALASSFCAQSGH